MMDFNTFLKGALPTLAANATEASGNASGRGGLSDNIVMSLMPLLGGQWNPLLKSFMMFYNVAGSRLGFDPTFILTFLGFAWALNKLWKQVYTTIYALMKEYLMANIHISSTDEMYLHMMKWLASQPNMFNSRSLTAETASKTAWEEEEDTVVQATTISADGSGVYLNFSNEEAKAPPRFIPALGTHGFFFSGRYFRLHRKQESLYDDGGSGGGGSFPQFKDKENLVISCFGRSPEPIKKLLQHAKEQYYDDHYAKTIVKRPSPQNMRRYGGRHSWQQVANRPVRPMKTVVLEAKQKVQVLNDINEYLHPATPRWYANRGIPLRRGYLFHGPPGTGKTSLSFALAGVFGLDIYVISLLEPSLTEEDLSSLFNSLPRRCVVLLEDIDTAGLTRPVEEAAKAAQAEGADKEKKGKKATEGTEAHPNDWKVSDLARELKRTNDPNEKKGISLSGLLNAIDGVASHEGRVLIMTTNKPESLDEALIRPGRVDLQVGFTNATAEQAKELFERMYEADSSVQRVRKHGVQFLSSLGVQAEVTAPLPSRPAPRAAANGSANGHAAEPTAKGAQANGHAANGHAAGPEGEKEEENDDEAAAQKKDEKAKPAGGAEDDERLGISPAELSRIATDFASRIPAGKFSPAEIQGFLLKRKKSPRKALDEVDVWVEAMIAQKASKTKVLQVQ